MSQIPDITPKSTTSIIVLPSTGSYYDVSGSVSLGVYSDSSSPLYSTDFISGAVDQVTYTYRKLGGDVIDIELTPANVYAAYEEATLEYSYIINSHQSKNILSNVLGNTTGTFDHDGNLKSGSLSSSLGATHISLKYPKFDFSYARRVADGISAEVGVGGTDTVYSASFDIEGGIQDYDLQSIISSSANTSSFPYAGLIGNTKLLVKRVFYKTAYAGWRFYGSYGNLRVVGNLSSYGQYADDSTFEVVPAWQNKLQAMAYEDSIYTRASHYSFELRNNKLRLFPIPLAGSSPSKMWVEFTIPSDTWVDSETDKLTGIDGINNMNTIPFSNIPYNNINSIGKQWIRRYALSLCKEMLGQIRGKFAVIPIPGDNVTLNAEQLLSQAQAEQEKLREELKALLDQLTYTELAKGDASLVNSSFEVERKIPSGIFVG